MQVPIRLAAALSPERSLGALFAPVEEQLNLIAAEPCENWHQRGGPMNMTQRLLIEATRRAIDIT